MNLLDGQLFAVARIGLDVSAMRQQVAAHNIANANSPGYRAVKLDFDTALANVSQTLAARPGASMSNLAEAFASPSIGETGPVQIDAEVADMGANALQYQAVVKALNRNLAILSIAMSDGRR